MTSNRRQRANNVTHARETSIQFGRSGSLLSFSHSGKTARPRAVLANTALFSLPFSSPRPFCLVWTQRRRNDTRAARRSARRRRACCPAHQRDTGRAVSLSRRGRDFRSRIRHWLFTVQRRCVRQASRRDRPLRVARTKTIISWFDDWASRRGAQRVEIGVAIEAAVLSRSRLLRLVDDSFFVFSDGSSSGRGYDRSYNLDSQPVII